MNNFRERDSKGVPPFHLFPSPADLKIPEELIGWLIEDLSAESHRKLLALPLFRDKLKGRRIQGLPREKVLELLTEAFHRDFTFRVEARLLWLGQRESDLRPLQALLPEDLRRSGARWMEEKGFPALYWHCLFSEDPALQKLAEKFLKDFHAAAQAPRQVENLSWTMAYGRAPASLEPAVPPQSLAAQAGLASELRRLKRDLEQSEQSRRTMEGRIASFQSAVRNLENEIASLQDRLRDSAKALKKKEESERAAADRAAALEGKLQAASSSDGRIRELEKRVRSREHDLAKARAETGSASQSVLRLERDLSAAQAARKEAEDSLAAWFRAAAPERGRRKAKTGNLLLIGDRERAPAEYYPAASSQGFALHYHPGFRRTPELEERIVQSETVAIAASAWERLDGAQDLVGLLRKKERAFRILPWLSAADFEAVLSDL